MAKDRAFLPRCTTARETRNGQRRQRIPLPVAAVLALLPPALLLWVVVFVSPTSAAGSVTFTVNSTLDEPDANTADLICTSSPSGLCTLRAAIEQANKPGGINPWTTATIVVPAGTYTLTAGHLNILATLTSLTVQGAGPTATIIDGNAQSRIFDMKTSSTLIASGMTIRNGRAGIGEANHYHGGGIHNHGSLQLSNAIVADNVVPTAAWGGGGITTAGGATASLENVTITGNQAKANGGGIENLGGLNARIATISDNSAEGLGGGIWHNSTAFSAIRYVTVANNSSPNGGGINRANGGSTGSIYATDSLLSNNTNQNCVGTLSSLGFNVSSDNTCALAMPTDKSNVDPKLGPLQDNGGGIPTRLPGPTSPAIDMRTVDCGGNDQRGVVRPQGAGCDTGAVEVRVFSVTLTNNGGGTSAGGGSYREGSAATLTASQSSGQTFLGWTVNGSPAGKANPLALAMDRDYTVVADFGPVPSFADVPVGYWAHDQIVAFAQRGITTGCDTNLYCPERAVTRAEMAVFVDRTLGFPSPPAPAAQRFSDVPANYWAYAFIDQFAQLGITTGCGGTEFCPDRGVTRAEMAAFLIRALKKGQLTAATPTFAEVPASHPQYGYVEALASLGVTTGCGTDGQGRKLFCPERGVTRAEMAVFIIRAFP